VALCGYRKIFGAKNNLLGAIDRGPVLVIRIILLQKLVQEPEKEPGLKDCRLRSWCVALLENGILAFKAFAIGIGQERPFVILLNPYVGKLDWSANGIVRTWNVIHFR
jgi:hypothetical protein